MNNKELYINISIKNYNSFENNIELIKLIDVEIIDKNEIIYETNYNIDWKQVFNNNQYDYKCNIKYTDTIDLIIIDNFIKNKFKFIQNFIKFYYEKFGTDWTINYIITYF